jgi:hypothetical protein
VNSAGELAASSVLTISKAALFARGMGQQSIVNVLDRR